ncbi:glutaminyl-peptide cyclotransferase [Lindgomyces ingoldianus]|uniref:Glutaminyl-peptide cyclotransferase n=1 Tax=Lindgomyces ingoldianus TaxID=673940 RepID=A0ACB6R2Z6_9PLEO|nr:glutaminyl-peptide cyclotransferase [Lindgomyces ingoldianus]KAF2473198.1 glutaminyl-peptide cyclotransferase [Lindgomyces ingoldianus]
MTGSLQLPKVFTMLWLSVIYSAALAHAYKPLSDSFLRAIPDAGADLDIENGTLLAPILIPRVPGTPGQLKVQHHFVEFFQRELPKWTIEWHNSTATTPATGNVELPFGNLVFKREPPWVKPGGSNLLTLVAHYDSKYRPEGFLGATDSAVPCAILMHVARSIDKYVTQMHDEMAELGEGGSVEMDMGVQILLLDGEEAFVSWTDTDSLYGARALAESWESSFNPAMSKYRNPNRQISIFVLLDLLGSANPKIPSYFLTTHWAYSNMANIEDRMRKLNLLESKPKSAFLPDTNRAMYSGTISDDHLPFMARGVPVLHVIPSPFPAVWHTMDDDGEHLDMPTVRDWAKIVTAFALEWLDMMEVWYEPKGMAGP